MRNASVARREAKPADRAGVRSFVAAPPDTILFASVAALVAIGLVMVFSASSATAYADYGDVAYYVKRQFVWLVVGLVAAFFAYRLDYQKLKKPAPYILLAAVVALALVFVPHIGLGANGGRRWIGFSSVSLQPSEFAKLAMVVYLSAMLAVRG